MGYKQKQLEEEHGDLHEVIPSLVNEHGQNKAAEKLGVTQSFISYWLKQNGYQMVTRYVRSNCTE